VRGAGPSCGVGARPAAGYRGTCGAWPSTRRPPRCCQRGRAGWVYSGGGRSGAARCCRSGLRAECAWPSIPGAGRPRTLPPKNGFTISGWPDGCMAACSLYSAPGHGPTSSRRGSGSIGRRFCHVCYTQACAKRCNPGAPTRHALISCRSQLPVRVRVETVGPGHCGHAEESHHAVQCAGWSGHRRPEHGETSVGR
jgi:hypothetical protein